MKRILSCVLAVLLLAGTLTACGRAKTVKFMAAVSLFQDDELSFAVRAVTSPRPEDVNGYYGVTLSTDALLDALKKSNTAEWESGTLTQLDTSMENALFLRRERKDGSMRYYLLQYDRCVRKANRRSCAFFGMEAGLNRREPATLVFPLPYFASDALPDRDGILNTVFQEKQLYRVTTAQEEFLAFYESMQAYRIERLENGFRITGYTDGVQQEGKAPALTSPVTFTFHQINGLSYVSME